VAVIAVAAAVIGDNIGYAIGPFGGRRLVEQFGRYLLITAQRFFSRHGGNLGAIYDQISRYQRYALAALGVFVIVLIVRHVLLRHRRSP
jgi:hypothetical protein